MANPSNDLVEEEGDLSTRPAKPSSSTSQRKVYLARSIR